MLSRSLQTTSIQGGVRFTFHHGVPGMHRWFYVGRRRCESCVMLWVVIFSASRWPLTPTVRRPQFPIISTAEKMLAVFWRPNVQGLRPGLVNPFSWLDGTAPRQGSSDPCSEFSVGDTSLRHPLPESLSLRNCQSATISALAPCLTSSMELTAIGSGSLRRRRATPVDTRAG